MATADAQGFARVVPIKGSCIQAVLEKEEVLASWIFSRPTPSKRRC